MELAFPKTRKDLGGAGLERKSGAEFENIMFEVFIKQLSRYRSLEL